MSVNSALTSWLEVLSVLGENSSQEMILPKELLSSIYWELGRNGGREGQ